MHVDDVFVAVRHLRERFQADAAHEGLLARVFPVMIFQVADLVECGTTALEGALQEPLHLLRLGIALKNDFVHFDWDLFFLLLHVLNQARTRRCSRPGSVLLLG